MEAAARKLDHAGGAIDEAARVSEGRVQRAAGPCGGGAAAGAAAGEAKSTGMGRNGKRV